MHRNFGEWYRLVSIERTDEVLKKRWAGVEEWVSIIRGDDDALLETVRIFHWLPERSSREGFLATFRKHDAAFAQRDNGLEQRVLAGAALVQCIVAWDDENEAHGLRAAIIAGTAVEASSFRAVDARLEEVSREVIAGLQGLARSQRKRTVFERNKIVGKAGAAAEALSQIPAGAVANWDQFKAQFTPVFQRLVEAFRSSDEAIAVAEQNIRRAEEETNILWWLEGGCSRDLNKPWAALPKEAVPLIAGSELAALTDIALGPQDVAAFVERIVSKVKVKEATIQTFVNAVPKEWLTDGDDTSALDLAPFSLALTRRAQADESRWKDFFEANTGLKVSKTVAPESVAKHAYVEAVLLRTLTSTED